MSPWPRSGVEDQAFLEPGRGGTSVQRSPDRYGRRAEWVAQRLIRPVNLIGRAWLDLEITGREHVPPAGPVVFAANHYSHIDPPLVSLAAGANVRYLAVDELFGQYRIFDAFTLYFGAIPLSRVRAPLGALKTALAHLEGGGLVGVFPEGRRVAYWGESAPKQGAAWLALRTGAPLVPVAICGTEGTLSLPEPGIRRTAVRVWLEPPLDPGAFADREHPRAEMTAEWQKALERRLGRWPDPSGETAR